MRIVHGFLSGRSCQTLSGTGVSKPAFLLLVSPRRGREEDPASIAKKTAPGVSPEKSSRLSPFATSVLNHVTLLNCFDSCISIDTSLWIARSFRNSNLPNLLVSRGPSALGHG